MTPRFTRTGQRRRARLAREQRRRVPSELTARPGPEDGVDPRHLCLPDERPLRSRRTLVRSQALCRQVREAVQLALLADVQDSMLQALEVLRVEPAPTARRLRVVARIDPELCPSRLECETKLVAIGPRLRERVAEAIHRKRTPELLFLVLPTTAPDR